MLRVRGIYDGVKVILLEPVTLLPDTKVDVWIPEIESDPEHTYWQRLMESGLVKEMRWRVAHSRAFTPVKVSGTSLSQAILDERR